MSVLNQIAFFQDRRDEVPNQEIARRLAETEDRAGILAIAASLWDENPNVQSDCVKVLYEVGYLDAQLIVPYATDFLDLLRSRHNRLVWGGMIALSTIAGPAADAIDPRRGEIMRAMEQGSVITVDAGVASLAGLASTSDERRQAILPYLLEHLRTCRPKDVPQRTLERRLPDLNASQAARIKRVIKQAATAS